MASAERGLYARESSANLGKGVLFVHPGKEIVVPGEGKIMIPEGALKGN